MLTVTLSAVGHPGADMKTATFGRLILTTYQHASLRSMLTQLGAELSGSPLERGQNVVELDDCVVRFDPGSMGLDQHGNDVERRWQRILDRCQREGLRLRAEWGV